MDKLPFLWHYVQCALLQPYALQQQVPPVKPNLNSVFGGYVSDQHHGGRDRNRLCLTNLDDPGFSKFTVPLETIHIFLVQQTT